MIEIIENSLQLVTTGLCMIVSLRKGILQQSRAWVILALASGVFFLGDLYWELFLVLYGITPEYSYIPYLSWYAAYLFVLLLLFALREDNSRRSGREHRKILWIIPVFTAGMCIFYMQYGDWIGNIISAVLMGLLIWHAADGLLCVREYQKELHGGGMADAGIYMVVLLFCLSEYGAWTTSCFWMGDTWRNPYFWFDTLLSVVFLLFPAALGKAVGK